MKHRYSALLIPLHILVDVLCLNAAFVGAYWIKFGEVAPLLLPPYASFWGIFNLVWLLVVAIGRPYVFPRQLFKFSELLQKLVVLMGVHMAIIAIYWVSVQGIYYSRAHLAYTYIGFFGMATAARVVGLLFLQEYRARGYNKRRYVVVGYGKMATLINRFYEAHPEMGFHFAGYFDWGNSSIADKLAGDYTQLPSFIRSNQIDCVYCCLPYVDNTQLKAIVDNAELMNYQVKLLVDFRGFLTKTTSVEYHDLLPILNVSSTVLDDFRVNVPKRAFDLLFSIGVLVFGFPIFLLLAVITAITSPGPIFYTQERIGRMGKPFHIYKFRSMYVNAEEAGPTLSQGLIDRRITPWGHFMRRTRIDELPQFYNVLRGDMSIVGPRPERQYFIDQIVEIAPDYHYLLQVKPGITSIGQIKYGYASSVEEMVKRLRYDLLYPKRRSFWLDMWIITQTLRVMMQGRGR